MGSRHALQLVLFDLPIAPLYGGTAEVDYKIRALLELGLELHIHAWVSSTLDRQLRSGARALPDWHQRVETLRWYPRPQALMTWLSAQPHAVASRSGTALNLALAQGPPGCSAGRMAGLCLYGSAGFGSPSVLGSVS